ncbi:MAG: type I phosphomannose isomerase catalytic subunit [Bacteroidales bacterium]|jgi:mannose-6-phosphate isomerase|nr:mannose-6-phosphate isomerase [Bacteroidales bacterium]
MSLYPLKFKTQAYEKIWGANRIKERFSKEDLKADNIGETWELSGVEGSESVVINGKYKDNNINELTEVFMDELVGDKVFQKYGNKFPLLFKLIDTSDYLSIQVHPDDEMAQQRHNSLGKTEMWYVVDSEEDSTIINGFNKDLTKEEYLNHLNNNTLRKVLEEGKTQAGDTYFIPAGRVHAIGKNILLAEIQQSSDVTYRIFDWNRVDDEGNPRQLHTEEAVDVIDYSKIQNPKVDYKREINSTTQLVECPYFVCNLLWFDKIVEKAYVGIDSFVAYMVVEGAFAVHYNGEEVEVVRAGETILIPAIIEEVKLEPIVPSKALEVYHP